MLCGCVIVHIVLFSSIALLMYRRSLLEFEQTLEKLRPLSEIRKKEYHDMLQLEKSKNEDVKKREAFVTLLVNEVDFSQSETYTYGDAAKVLVYSLLYVAKTKRDVIVFVLPRISVNTRQFLSKLGAQIIQVELIDRPTHNMQKKPPAARWLELFTKLRLWQFTKYEKIVYIDSDCIVLRNIDFLFGYPELSAPQNTLSDGREVGGWSAHVFVMQPSNKTFDELTYKMHTENFPTEYVEQSFLNWFFGEKWKKTWPLSLDPVVFANVVHDEYKKHEAYMKLPLIHDKFWKNTWRVMDQGRQVWLDFYTKANNLVKMKENT